VRDALGGRNRTSLVGIDRVTLEAVIKQVWRCTWRLRSSELRDALGGHN